MTFDYRRQFFYLALAAAVLAVLQDNIFPREYRIESHYGLIGALHAAAMALTLLKPHPLLLRLAFVLAAGLLSIGALLGGVLLGGLLLSLLPSDVVTPLFPFVLLALGSMIGAATYWLLVRTLWARHLGGQSLLLTIAFCVGATLCAVLTIEVLPQGIGNADLLTILWWAAFSGSLFVSEQKLHDGQQRAPGDVPRPAGSGRA